MTSTETSAGFDFPEQLVTSEAPYLIGVRHHSAAMTAAVPGRIDLVDVFRAPEHVDEIVDTCIALKLPALWLQEGVVNEAAARRAQDAGLTVVMDRCVYRDYVRLFGAGPRSGA